MRYFLYIVHQNKPIGIVVDENADRVRVYPPERMGHCSEWKSEWLDYYDNLNQNGRIECMFEVCENQFKKFAEKGEIPECHDAYFVAQRKIRT